MVKSTLLELILSTSGAKAGMLQIEHSGHHFVDFWSQGQKVLKSSLLGVILSISEAKARKCSNLCSWEGFWEGSGRALGELWEGSGRALGSRGLQGCLGGSLSNNWHHSAAVCERTFLFFILRSVVEAPITKHCKLQ